ncbi:MAG: hypothetical protein ACRDM1_15085 [Gaiellaceae bacterium]
MDAVSHFVAEAYEPTDATQATADLQQAAGELRAQGRTVRHLLSLLAPEEQVCLHLVEAGSADLVAELGSRAAIRFDRVWPAVYLDPPHVEAPPHAPRRPGSSRKESHRPPRASKRPSGEDSC